MISLRIQTLAAAVAGAASLLAGAAHAGGPPCATAADCGGSYRPASPAYAFTPPGPAYATQGGYGQAAYAPQGAYPAGYVGYDEASRGPARGAPAHAGYDRAPSYTGGYARTGYAQGAYAEGGYAYGGQVAYGYGSPYPSPVGPDCGTVCVPAYQVVQLPPETVQLATDVYTGGVGITEISGGGGGGFNGNFEVQGFGNVAAFASSHAQAQADAVSYARSLSYAKASAEANANAYAKATSSASANVNIKLNTSFYAKANFKPYNKGANGCSTCAKPQPVACNTCGGSGGVGYGGGMGGWGKGGFAPSPRGGKHP